MDGSGPGLAQARGLTLAELLITLLILSVLLQVSLPHYSDLIARSRGDALMDALSKAIRFTRATAVTSGKITTLCRSNDAESCGGRWEEGLLVFHDSDGELRLKPGQQPLLYVDLDERAGRLQWRAFRNRQFLQFTPQGYTRYQNGNFTFCPESGQERLARQLILSRTGKLREARDTDGDGIPEDSRGRPLRC